MTIKSMIDHSKLVNEAKRDNLDITYYPIDVATAGIVAMGNTSFANAGKKNTESQAEWVLMLVDNADGKFFTEWEGRATLMRWRSHKLKRRVRSTLAAETMASGEAAEAGDVLREHVAEVHHELDMKSKDACLRKVPMVLVTDCRSLHDLLNKRGAVPEEQRLLLDIASTREQKELTGLSTKWVNTKQQSADCLTKNDAKAGDCLRYVLKHAHLHLVE